MQKGKRFGAVVLLGAWPDDNSIGHGIDIEHLRDMLAARQSRGLLAQFHGGGKTTQTLGSG